MTQLGYLLITVGFLLASLVASQTSENVINWTTFLPALGLSVVGVALAQLGSRARSRDASTLQSGVGDLRGAIDRIVASAERLQQNKQSIDVYALHGTIDEWFVEDLNVFVEARESISHVYGLQVYAEMMNEYAAGERYLNRVWSASVDGYIDEAHQYIGRAAEQFRKTAAIVGRLAPAPHAPKG